MSLNDKHEIYQKTLRRMFEVKNTDAIRNAAMRRQNFTEINTCMDCLHKIINKIMINNYIILPKLDNACNTFNHNISHLIM